MSRTDRDHPHNLPKNGPRFWVKCTKSRCWICRYRPKGKRQRDLRKAVDFDILANESGWEESSYLARNAKIEEEILLDEYYNDLRSTE